MAPAARDCWVPYIVRWGSRISKSTRRRFFQEGKPGDIAQVSGPTRKAGLFFIEVVNASSWVGKRLITASKFYSVDASCPGHMARHHYQQQGDKRGGGRLLQVETESLNQSTGAETIMMVEQR